MNFGFGVNVGGVRVGGFSNDHHRGHHGHHSSGAFFFSAGSGGYPGVPFYPGGSYRGDNTYELTARNRAIKDAERQDAIDRGLITPRAGRDYDVLPRGASVYEVTARNRERAEYEREERMWREEERRAFDGDVAPGRAPGYGRGYVGPRYDARSDAAFAVRREEQLRNEDRIAAPQMDEYPQETTGRPPQETPARPSAEAAPQQSSAPAVDNPAPAPAPAAEASPPAAEPKSTPVEQPRAVAANNVTSADQKKLNQEAQLYLERIGQETGGKNRRVASANAGQNFADQLDGIVGPKTKEALKAHGFTEVTPEVVATLKERSDTVLAMRAEAAAEKNARVATAATTATVVAAATPLAATVSPTVAAVVGATMVAQNNPEIEAFATSAMTTVTTVAKDQLAAMNSQAEEQKAAANVTPPAQSDAGPILPASQFFSVSSTPPVQSDAGPSLPASQFFSTQSFAPEASAPVQPAPMLVSRSLTVDEMERGKEQFLSPAQQPAPVAPTLTMADIERGKLFLNSGVTGGQDVSVAGAAPTNVGQKPNLGASVGPV